MSAQPYEPAPAPAPPAAGAAGEIRAQIQDAPEAERWLPAFDRDWAAALAAARESFTLAPAHQVIADWRVRLATAPAVRAFIASGYDDSDGVPLEDVIGPRR
ncbi:DUF6247 family protein [Streptacidiphilus anmyonensis]|uniref:DUF6247 family protein n=1 Tax=Streptacidiphilus anmyonensis TaxID=405782 RepID=UPI0005A73DBF|nr:DUF6247 family protein [Streptacidiphilus anmyonensis]